MRVKATLINFKSKLSKSCNKFVSLFRFKVKKPVFVRPLRSRSSNVKPKQNPQKKPSSSSSSSSSSLLSSCLCFLMTSKKQQTMSQTRLRNSSCSVSDDEKFVQSPITPAAPKKLFPSPITTPVYATRTKKTLSQRDAFEDDDAVEDACRGFENYLIHLIVEEGKMDDLMDIEELLFCWKNLKNPVFIDLVSRFYGELCRDLFSGE